MLSPDWQWQCWLHLALHGEKSWTTKQRKNKKGNRTKCWPLSLPLPFVCPCQCQCQCQCQCYCQMPKAKVPGHPKGASSRKDPTIQRPTKFHSVKIAYSVCPNYQILIYNLINNIVYFSKFFILLCSKSNLSIPNRLNKHGLWDNNGFYKCPAIDQ